MFAVKRFQRDLFRAVRGDIDQRGFRTSRTQDRERLPGALGLPAHHHVSLAVDELSHSVTANGMIIDQEHALPCGTRGGLRRFCIRVGRTGRHLNRRFFSVALFSGGRSPTSLSSVIRPQPPSAVRMLIDAGLTSS